MKFVLYTNALSTHQMPLAKEIAKRVGAENFRYIYTGESGQEWQQGQSDESWIVKATEHPWLEEADVALIGGIRPIDLMERRAAKGLKTFYQSERWFKPPLGRLRLLVPSYRRMAKRFVKVVNEHDSVKFLAIGPWAKGDFLKMGIKPEKIVDWGYFVAPSVLPPPQPSTSTSRSALRVLWAGRDIPLKHVRDIERAVEMVNGRGGDSCHATRMSRLLCTFTKLTGVSPGEVRKSMREHDVFVFASNGYEGWGAVVSEALEEGMNVIGTWECGACPTLLPKERLYHCGDVKALARLLALEVEERGGGGQRMLPPCRIGEWTAKRAAERLVAL